MSSDIILEFVELHNAVSNADNLQHESISKLVQYWDLLLNQNIPYIVDKLHQFILSIVNSPDNLKFLPHSPIQIKVEELTHCDSYLQRILQVPDSEISNQL